MTTFTLCPAVLASLRERILNRKSDTASARDARMLLEHIDALEFRLASVADALFDGPHFEVFVRTHEQRWGYADEGERNRLRDCCRIGFSRSVIADALHLCADCGSREHRFLECPKRKSAETNSEVAR
jgi:hypothetical protein